MRFSIVIPAFRTERFLPRCLDSLIAQTDGDFEAIVVDDYSPGDAGCCSVQEILSKYDSRFRCLRHAKNRGAFQARCTGVAAAKGDYVVPVDPDDYLMPETLAKLREAIDREMPDLVSYRMAYDNGKKVYDHWCHHPNATVSGIEALRELSEHKYFTGVASKAFRRETLLAAMHDLNAPKEFYANTCDDFLMLVPMLMKSERVSFLDFVGYRYFVNGNSTSFSWKKVGGFLRARRQTHQVGRLILRTARRADVSPTLRGLVETSVSVVERWFVQNAVQNVRLSLRNGILNALRKFSLR